MRILTWLITLPVFLALLSFALANRHDVTLSFWPFDAEITLPLSLLVLGFLFSGVLLGTFMGWMGGMPQRLQTRALRRELAAANKKIEMLQAKAPVGPAAEIDDYIFDQPKKRLSGF